MRRLATIALSLSLVLGLAGTHRLLAQGEEKKEAPKPEAAPPEAAKSEAAKAAPPAPSAAPEPAPPTIPPDVQAKLEAARRAVAEAIVAAEDAGLVKTSIDPPPVLDILVNGYANDQAAVDALKSADAKPAAVSPEVFGAWFAGYGKNKEIVPQKQIRIVRPKLGLEDLYNKRANLLKTHIDAVRKAKTDAAKAAEDAKNQEEARKQEEAKKKEEEAKKQEQAKKQDEAKKEESKDDAKKDEPKADDSKKGDEPK